jgi:hypothetical protein
MILGQSKDNKDNKGNKDKQIADAPVALQTHLDYTGTGYLTPCRLRPMFHGGQISWGQISRYRGQVI